MIAESALVSEILEEYGTRVRQRLRTYLPEGEPQRSLWALAADYPTRGGRMLRPSVCLAATRACGGDLDAALGSACALELLHNAFLVHDDVEDGSQSRRGLPTMHAANGVPIAINVGDALTILSLRPLIENREGLGATLALRLLEETERIARESVEGQAIELSWRAENVHDLTDTEYLEMILKKTCWYTFMHPLRVGALMGRTRIDPDRFNRLGFFLGAAFQIQDDILNLIGDETVYGKEINGDLWEGKRTLMLIHLYRRATSAERQRLRAIFRDAREERSARDVAWVRERIDAYRCVESAQAVAHGLAGAALHEFDMAFESIPDSRDRRFLRNLATWVLDRE